MARSLRLFVLLLVGAWLVPTAVEARQPNLTRLGGKDFRQALSNRLVAIHRARPTQQQALIAGLVKELAPMHGAILERKVGGQSRMAKIATAMRPYSARSGRFVPRPITREGHHLRWMAGDAKDKRNCSVGVTRSEGRTEVYRGFQLEGHKRTTLQTAVSALVPGGKVRFDQTSSGLQVVFTYDGRRDGLRTEAYRYNKQGAWQSSTLFYNDGVLTETAKGTQVQTL